MAILELADFKEPAFRVCLSNSIFLPFDVDNR